ncbi:MAG: MBL fold metallo-hydrolase [Pseudomonadota bacterium]
MEPQTEIVILGSAGGAAYVYDRACSSSFVILRDGEPELLCDFGFGVMYALQEAGLELPPAAIITHNHSDHAGELPVVLRVEQARDRLLGIVAHPRIEERLKVHRLAEHAALFPPETLARWKTGSQVQEGRWTIRFHEGRHSTPCFGFTLHEGGRCRFGYSSDSTVHPPLYDALGEADVVIFNGREQGNTYHAGFDDLAPYLKPDRYIIGHGLSETRADLPLLFPGDRIRLP